MDRATDEGSERDEIEGPLEDALAVLRERMPPDRTLLDPAELDQGAPEDAERAEAEADEELERAEEAEFLVEPPPALPPDSLTPELLEQVLEPDVVPAEAALHEEDALTAALLDEGVPLEGFDEDAVEWELERRRTDEE
jgi:hypothetical protein